MPDSTICALHLQESVEYSLLPFGQLRHWDGEPLALIEYNLYLNPRTAKGKMRVFKSITKAR